MARRTQWKHDKRFCEILSNSEEKSIISIMPIDFLDYNSV